MNQKELIPYYDDILSLYQQGVTLRKIGKKYGSGHTTIKGILIKNGDFIENREVLSVKIPECEHQNIINCYNFNENEEIENIERKHEYQLKTTGAQEKQRFSKKLKKLQKHIM